MKQEPHRAVDGVVHLISPVFGSDRMANGPGDPYSPFVETACVFAARVARLGFQFDSLYFLFRSPSGVAGQSCGHPVAASVVAIVGWVLWQESAISVKMRREAGLLSKPSLKRALVATGGERSRIGQREK
jgi:hypothetical protein